jgi:hypothetical protein
MSLVLNLSLKTARMTISRGIIRAETPLTLHNAVFEKMRGSNKRMKETA